MGAAPLPSRLVLRAPVIVAVVAATAIPIDIGSFANARMHFGWFLPDAIANVLGYVPVGIVLASAGVVRATIVAFLMSLGTEVLQLGMVHRDPSFTDIACNVAGAFLGSACAVALRMTSATITLGRASALGACALCVYVVFSAWAAAGPSLNPRGVSEPGTLEAQWKLDEIRTNTETKPDSKFRIVGSMTLAAWINASSFPRDDAVVVSTLEHLEGIRQGWQLDTSIDRGPRVIGFKLTGSCGTTMARYGATPLQPNVWYHIAAVYDAQTAQMDVYLNGKLDDGDLVGPVEHVHRSSRRGASIGRRGDLDGFEFSGLLNDVRVYSRSLTATEVAGLVGKLGPDGGAPTDPASSHAPAVLNDGPRDCQWSAEPEDARLPALVVVGGVSVAILCAWALTRSVVAGLLASLAIGLLMFFVSTPTLPAFNLWAFPLTALAGGVSVLASIRRD
jgi:VanZ family protein